MAVFNKAVMAESAAPIQEAVASDINVFDIMIEAERLDQSLFESLIEVDFAEAYNEAGIIALTEEEQASAGEAQKKGIFAKLWEAIQNAGKAIAKLFDDVISFIANLISNDAKLSENYKSVMNYSTLSGKCPVKGKYVDFKYYDEKKKAFGAALAKLDGSDKDINVTAVSVGVEYSRDDLIKNSEDKAIVGLMGSNNFDDMVNLVGKGYKKEMGEAKEAKKKALEYLKSLEKKYKEVEKGADKNSGDAAGANAAYKQILSQSVKARKISAAYVSMVNNALAVNRGCFLKIAAWAKKNADAKGANINNKDEAKTNTDRAKAPDFEDSESFEQESALQEAIDMLIEMENDAFIESITV